MGPAAHAKTRTPKGPHKQGQAGREKVDSGRVRARQGGRAIARLTGSGHKLYRQPYKLGDRTMFVRWDGISRGRTVKLTDSIVHRYGREVGFQGADGNAPDRTDGRAVASTLQNAALVYKPRSTSERAKAQSQLECYVLEHHANSQYARFLQDVKSEIPVNAPVRAAALVGPYMQTRQLMQPPVSILESLMRHMRAGDTDETAAAAAPGDHVRAVAGRMNKGNTIDKVMKCLSGTMLEFGQPPIARSPAMKIMIDEWTAVDTLSRAVSFDLEKVLPMLWVALWGSKISFKKKVAIWTMLLVQLAVIGRSSDITDNCPLNASVTYPSTSIGFMADGTPLWIQVDWTHWKGRKKGQRGAYPIKIHANPKNTRFCPVHWLLEHWSLRNDNDGSKDGTAPILDKIGSETWREWLKQLFLSVGLHSYSSHSLRRSAAMWASRCGATLYVIKNVGRWETVEQMLLYVAEGRLMMLRAIKENGGVDPVWSFWSFSIDTMVGTLECDARLMEALMQEV